MPHDWNDAVLDSLRHVGDPEADAAVAEYIATYPEVTSRSVMQSLVRSQEVGDRPLTPLLVSYLADNSGLPHWADVALIVSGQEVFAEFGLEIATSLFCASLPTAYAAERGSRVIFETAELVSQPHRRIAETAQMICDVMSVELSNRDPQATALGPGTRGYDSARGVRLMHAAVRQLVQCDEAMATCSVDEVPVNQEDLLGTLLTFTTVVFRSLHRLGAPLTATQQAAYLHAWCVVGHLLGIRSDLLPLTSEEAEHLDDLIRSRQNASGASGQLLARALENEMQRNVPGWLNALPAALVRRAAGEDIADLLQLRRSGFASRRLVQISVYTTQVWHRVAPARLRRAAGSRISRMMIRRYVEIRRGSRPPWDFRGFQR